MHSVLEEQAFSKNGLCNGWKMSNEKLHEKVRCILLISCQIDFMSNLETEVFLEVFFSVTQAHVVQTLPRVKLQTGRWCVSGQL